MFNLYAFKHFKKIRGAQARSQACVSRVAILPKRNHMIQNLKAHFKFYIITRESFLLELFFEKLHLFSEKLQNGAFIKWIVAFLNQFHMLKKVITTFVWDVCYNVQKISKHNKILNLGDKRCHDFRHCR